MESEWWRVREWPRLRRVGRAVPLLLLDWENRLELNSGEEEALHAEWDQLHNGGEVRRTRC